MRILLPAALVASIVSVELITQGPPGGVKEFWFVLLGQIRCTIEGVPTFIADQGDIVYVPKQRWHRASLAGDGMSARLR